MNVLAHIQRSLDALPAPCELYQVQDTILLNGGHQPVIIVGSGEASITFEVDGKQQRAIMLEDGRWLIEFP